MAKQKSAAAAGAVATGPVPRPPVLEHTTAELVSLIANLSEREDFTVDILGQAFALAQQRVGISDLGPRCNADRAAFDRWTSIQASTAGHDVAYMGCIGQNHWAHIEGRDDLLARSRRRRRARACRTTCIAFAAGRCASAGR